MRRLGLSLFILGIIFFAISHPASADTTICGTYSTNVTWTTTGSPYIVTCTSTISATLTINPGVSVKFASATRLTINGKLTAIGTAANPITFTSNAATPAAGNWRSIYFGASADPASRISYATISYGGATDLGAISVYINSATYVNIDHVTVSNSSSSGIYINVATVIIDAATITNCSAAGVTVNGWGSISNSTVSNNGTYGINLTSYSGFGFSGDTISNNANYAIGADSTTQINYMSALTLTGNGGGSKNAVGLRGGQLLVSSVWRSGAVWEILGSCTSGSTSTLTINPGVTAKFASGTLLTINGTLVANGTETAPIVFTSNLATPTNGSWEGIFLQSANSNSRISYATVAYGGRTSGNINGAIVLYNSAATIEHVTVLNSPAYGIRINVTTPIKSVIRGGMFANNTSGGISNTTSTTADATLNYWNDPTGPSGVGPGSGQSISSNIEYDPWLTAAPTTPHFFSDVTVLNQRFNAAASTVDILDFETSTAGNWTATFRNAIGTIVRTFTGSGTEGTVAWDGKDQSETLLLDGTYTFLLESVSNASETAAPVKGTVIIDSTMQLQIQNLSGTAFFSPNADGIQDVFSVTAGFNFDDANWTINIKNVSGTIIQTATGQGASVSYSWDGKDSSGTLQLDGVYTAELLVTDGTLSASGTRATTLDNTFPVSTIDSPSQSTLLSNVYQQANINVTVIATIDDTNLQNWILDRGAGASPSSWTTLLTGTSPSSNNGIITWDTGSLANGVYTLRLQTWDKAGNRTEHRVTVTLGNFKASMDVRQINVATSQTVKFTSIVPFALTETITIKDSQNQVVRTLVNGVSRNAGTYLDSWNGKTDVGGYLPDGGYRYIATVTDGTNSMTWDLSSQNPGTWQVSYPIYPAWDPFNNNPLVMTIAPASASRILVAFSPTYITGVPPHGSIASGCNPPNYCLANYEYRESGTHTFVWAGVDGTGALLSDMKGYTLQYVSMEDNAVVVYGTRPKITNGTVTVSPPLFNPDKGPQTVSFAFTSFQNQTVDVTATFINQSSLSILRTINLIGVNPGNINISWDGKADNGMWVAPGGYTVTVKITDSIGNSASSQILTMVRY